MQRKTFVIGGLLASILMAGSQGVFAQGKPFKVGVTAGPHAQIMEVVKRVASKEGLNIQIVEFSDYVLPNEALASGDLAANSFQHQPYLDNQVKDRGYKIVSVAQTVIFPMGIYSKKVKKTADLGTGARVGIPNDPTNGGRALLLLQQVGLIKLAPNVGLKATPLDITANPKRLKIVELDAAQLARSLDELDAAAVNTNYALPAGLDPKRDAIVLEDPKSPYANVLAVRAADKNSPDVAKFVKAYHSPEVKSFVVETFKGSALPAW